MSNNDTPPIGYDHPTTVPTNHNEGTIIQSMGHIVFDASTSQAFLDLVKETLESSDFITTKWYDMDGHPDDVLLVQMVGDEDPEVLVDG